jgi:resuscitation-promoting factor RpfB
VTHINQKGLCLYIGVFTVALVLAGCGGAAGEQQARPAAAVDTAAASSSAPAPSGPPSSAAPPPSATPPSATPRVEKRKVTETVKIPFPRRTVNDSSLPEGTQKIRVRGVAGTKTLTYEVTYTDGVQTGKRLLSQKITEAPVAQVTAIGTKPQQKCDPNYSGACVPIASDVDCAGGSGNGPAYVTGPVQVIGEDIYDLDRDGDGVGCDS